MKKKYFIWLLLVVTVHYGCTKSKPLPNSTKFVKVINGKLTIDNKPYTFVGVNYWYGSNLAALGAEGQARLIRELDYLKQLGVTNLRIQACSEGGDEVLFGVKPSLQPKPGEYNETLFQGLDFLLSELNKRDMKAVLALNNYWSWTGGMAKYRSWAEGSEIPYPASEKLGSWDIYMQYADGFYENTKAVEAFKQHISVMLNRTNTITQVKYSQDPAIMAWQLANEPRGGKSEAQRKIFIKWIHETAAYIKSLDTLHLVSTGSEGSVGHHWNMDDYTEAHNTENIDYLTLHLWPQNWGWFNPENPEGTIDSSLVKAKQYIFDHLAVSKKLNKPITLEEYGLARDKGSFLVNSETKYRNLFFGFVFSLTTEQVQQGNLSGSNFWSWAGEGTPPRPGELWKTGDPFLGDPPHEAQGWYSVYQTDTNTISIIKEYTNKLPK